ncbi:MAG: nucleotidyltransferase domain-containing protein [Bryobacteraceae bacterium]|nr:nucleotidyltransferase domain-containing protein [Bryobacteraceae bacterium]
MKLTRDPMDLTATVQSNLDLFLEVASRALLPDLVSVVLFGSAAENRLRPVSDVNLILVLRRFDPDRIAALSPALQTARAAIRLDAMFLLDSEIAEAAEAFADKFSDILRRRKVLAGPDVFAGLQISREARKTRLRQSLMNFILRTRHTFAMRQDQPDQLAALLAASAGPLRSFAAAWAELAGRPAAPPRESLASLLAEWQLGDLANNLSLARENNLTDPGAARSAVLQAIEAAERIKKLLEGL